MPVEVNDCVYYFELALSAILKYGYPRGIFKFVLT